MREREENRDAEKCQKSSNLGDGCKQWGAMDCLPNQDWINHELNGREFIWQIKVKSFYRNFEISGDVELAKFRQLGITFVRSEGWAKRVEILIRQVYIVIKLDLNVNDLNIAFD